VANDDDMATEPNAELEGSWSPRRPKRAAKPGTGKDADPEVLAGEIEKTREELAETIDAIADKVSPQRVKARTKQKASAKASEAAETVKETASEAAETVKETASEAAETVKETASEAAETVKETASEAAETVKEAASEAAESLKETATEAAEAVKGRVAQVKGKLAGDTSGSPTVDLTAASPLPGAEVPYEPAPTPGALADTAVTPLEPVGGETYPGTLPPYTSSPSSKAPLVGAGVLALVAFWLLRRRSGKR
jgi:MYXO-CTERM domain-containing protein